MDIRYLSRRNHEYAVPSAKAAAGSAQARQIGLSIEGPPRHAQPAAATPEVQAPVEAGATPAPAPATGTAEQPATMPHFSPAGRLLNALQSFEERHPEETKAALGKIAERLRADSEHAGVWGDRLAKWADRFQQAADTGDMSNLMPRLQSHFGVRAYQQHEQPAPEADETVEHVAGVAASHTTTAAAPAAPAADSGVQPTAAAPATATDAATSGKPSGEGSKGTGGTDMRDRPVTVPESATTAATQ